VKKKKGPGNKHEPFAAKTFQRKDFLLRRKQELRVTKKKKRRAAAQRADADNGEKTQRAVSVTKRRLVIDSMGEGEIIQGGKKKALRRT